MRYGDARGLEKLESPGLIARFTTVPVLVVTFFQVANARCSTFELYFFPNGISRKRHFIFNPVDILEFPGHKYDIAIYSVGCGCGVFSPFLCE